MSNSTPSTLPQGTPSTLPRFTTAFRAEDLPDPQRLALEALLQGRTKAEIARHARTSERTLRRWQRDPHFTAALRQARCDAWIETTTQLQHLNRNVLAALQRVLDSDSPHAQVYAAKTVLLLTVKALDVEAMCGRIAQAEADLEAHLNGGTKPTFYSDPEDEDGNEDPGSASDPTVPAPAGTPQGDGSGGIHPVAEPAPNPNSVNRSRGRGPATRPLPARNPGIAAHEGDRHPAGNSAARDDSGNETDRECRPDAARTGQTRTPRASESPEGGSLSSPGFHPAARLRSVGEPCSANGATPYQPGATPPEPSRRGSPRLWKARGSR